MSNSEEDATPSADADTVERTDSPDGQAAASSNDRIVTNSACVGCRSKHLKCDGLRVCSRCASQGISCVYLKSRRGYRGSSARGRQLGPAHGNSSHDRTDKMPYASASSSTINHLSLSGGPSSSESLYGGSYGYRPMFMPAGTQLSSKVSDSANPDSRRSGSIDRQRCIDAFYHYFHGSHPFLPPRHHFLQVAKGRPTDHLLTAMCYLGSRYLTGAYTASYAPELELLVLAPPAEDASVVQAMLLYALGLDGGGEQTKAVDILVKAQHLALKIGMNTREYAIVNGQGSPVCEESLRRSWHELYVVCVMAAGFHGRRPFHVQDLKSAVPLPCEEREFGTGSIPPLYTFEDFEEDGFNDEDVEWSSYTYRIAAARNLDRIILSTQFCFPDDHTIQRQEAYLTNWKLHLPESKKAFYDESGTFDEMLFQAHMITDVSSILLHRHNSRLEALAVQTITSCSANEQVNLAPMPDNLHTFQTAQAAANISRLVAIPTPLINHTHFFVCALALSSIAHLSTWSALPIISKEQDLKELIRLNAGALKAIAKIWPSSRMGFGQVTKAAQMIYANRKDAAEDVFWRDFMQEDIMTELIESTMSVEDPLSDRLLDQNDSSHA
ncbi:related to Zn(II)2Cys6 transcriptional activator [Phialocephala subalpina]|uniref:Related to Zn(II)2Cys6 transcriptional activator n=1 Tax=Phialocephala subalpina TaxID=576137 RepID=A0A1L7WUM5_9HELO|nr:related to Zn(II)2Cys6 transcriptional activator [Phialocephala subalpina]